MPQCFWGSKTLQCRQIEPHFCKGWYLTITPPLIPCPKTVATTALFTPYFSTFPVALTAFLIDDIITAQKNNFDADTLDGCLHFVCKLDRRVERTLTLGDFDNQKMKRRSAIDQNPFAHPHLYLENLILPGGIKTCEPQKETREQFRYSAAHH